MKQLNGLFIDDERNPEDVTWVKYPKNIKWKIVRDYWDFKEAIFTDIYDVISFDHDLQDFDGTIEYTGYECLKDFIHECMFNTPRSNHPYPEMIYHTQNPIGRENMKCLWENYLKFNKEHK